MPASLAVLFVAAFLAGGCQQVSDSQKQALGSTAGAIIGGVLGSQIGSGTGRVVATLIGAAAGGFLGYKLTSLLTEEEEREVAQATHEALESAPAAGTSTVWTSQDGDTSADIKVSGIASREDVIPATARQNYEIDQEALTALPEDTVCRQVGIDIVSGRRTASDDGVYCRDAEGDYVRVSAA